MIKQATLTDEQSGSQTTRVTVIATVKNEGESIRGLLDSLAMQTLLPDEVVISDGGSTDNTVEILEQYKRYLPLKVIEAKGANISEGRNVAIAAASNDIIATTDAGVVLAPRWVEAITAPIRKGQCQVVGGFFESDPYTDFEVVMGATVLPDRSDIDPRTFLPTSRSVAFTKQAWESVGGYPEWLDYCEDLIFDLDLKEKFAPFGYAGNAIVYFRPRGNMRAYAKQYYLYSRGDGKADLWRKRHAIRYFTYLVALPIMLLGMSRNKRRYWITLPVAGFIYCWRPFQRLWRTTEGWNTLARLRALALVPVIRLVGDVAKMIGYPVGWVWRLRQNPPR